MHSASEGCSPHRLAVQTVPSGWRISGLQSAPLSNNVDNRVMYSVGVGALSLGWLEGCGVAYGIPLRASGKDIFFDRTR